MFDNKGIIDIVFESSHKDILESLDTFSIITTSNQKVLLKDVVEFIKVPAYSQIFKENNEQIISVTASLNKITSAELYQTISEDITQLRKRVNLDIKGEQKENEKVKKEFDLKQSDILNHHRYEPNMLVYDKILEEYKKLN